MAGDAEDGAARQRIARLEAQREADHLALRDFMERADKGQELIHKRIGDMGTKVEKALEGVELRLDKFDTDLNQRRGAARIIFAVGTAISGSIGGLVIYILKGLGIKFGA
jgi:hypothetical protein